MMIYLNKLNKQYYGIIFTSFILLLSCSRREQNKDVDVLEFEEKQSYVNLPMNPVERYHMGLQAIERMDAKLFYRILSRFEKELVYQNSSWGIALLEQLKIQESIPKHRFYYRFAYQLDLFGNHLSIDDYTMIDEEIIGYLIADKKLGGKWETFSLPSGKEIKYDSIVVEIKPLKFGRNQNK